MSTRRKTIDQWIWEQKRWIEKCGGSLAGYIARYGSASDPEHSGDGGEAIYKADMNELARLEAMRDRGRRYL